MVKHNFDKILTVILIIIIIAIVIVAGFWGYDIFQRYYLNVGANEVLEEFDNKIANLNTIVEPTITPTPIVNETDNNLAENPTTSTPTPTRRPLTTPAPRPANAIDLKYKGYDVAGKIEIPATNLKYPVLTVATDSSMKISVGILYGVGLNQIGNTVIMGHNYRNGSLFSRNDDIKNGDEIFITDITGTRIRYIVYNKYYTTSTDFEYGTRDTAGTREITLESCTDDGRSRIIICAREENT